MPVKPCLIQTKELIIHTQVPSVYHPFGPSACLFFPFLASPLQQLRSHLTVRETPLVDWLDCPSMSVSALARKQASSLLGCEPMSGLTPMSNESFNTFLILSEIENVVYVYTEVQQSVETN